MSIKSPLSRQFGSRFDEVFDVVKSNPVYDKVSRIPTLDLDFAKSKSLYDGRSTKNLITFTRNSTGTYVGSDGLIKTAAVNEARFNHNPTTGESLGLLVEEQRTNNLTYSEQLNDTAWAKTRSNITANAETAPTGALVADKLVEDTTATNSHRLDRSFAWASGTVYTYSIFCKAGERTKVRINLPSAAFTVISADFDLSTGTITGGSGTIVAFANGWYRCIITGTANASTTASILHSLFDGSGVVSYTGDGTSGIYLWGAQLEAGSFPTSYIPTTTAAATRSADVASITGTNFSSWYRQDEYTAFIDFSNEATAGLDRRLLSFAEAGGFGVNGATLFVSNAAQRAASFNNFVASANIGRVDSSLSVSARTRRRAAFSFAASSRVLSVDGETPVVSTNAFTPPSNIIFAEFFNAGGGGHNNGHIRRLTYWDTRLPNEKLKSVTT